MIAEFYWRKIIGPAFGIVCGLGAWLEASAQPAPDYAALIAAPDRSDTDRQADKRRDPVPLLTFADVRPGMKVLDMGAGGGYSTELFARAVAPGGIVYGQNPTDLPEKPKTAFEARLNTPAMKNVVAEYSRHEKRCGRHSTLRRPGAAGRTRSRSHYISVLLPRHDLHERRPSRDGPRTVRGLEAWRVPDHR